MGLGRLALAQRMIAGATQCPVALRSFCIPTHCLLALHYIRTAWHTQLAWAAARAALNSQLATASQAIDPATCDQGIYMISRFAFVLREDDLFLTVL